MTASTSRTPTLSRTARSPRRLLVAGAAAAVVAAAILGWLVWPKPPGPVVLHAGTSHYVVTATVGSGRIGTTDIEIDLSTRAGASVDRAMVEVQAIMPLMGHAAPPTAADSLGHGHFRAAQVPLMMTGPWELQVSIDAPDGADSLVLPLTVTG